MSIPLHELSNHKALRIAYCYQCKTMTKVEPYEGPPEYDQHLQYWIDQHLHGKSPDDARGMVFAKDASQFDHTGMAGDAIEEQMIEEVRAELAQANLEVYAMRDGLKYDAVVCHRKHGQPSWPGKLCADYQADQKRVGRTDVPEQYQQYLCTYCPYEETVRVQKRWQAGQYK